MKHIWRAVQFIPEYRGRLAAVLAVGTALGALAAFTPYLYKHIVDAIAGLLAGRMTYDQAARAIVLLIGGLFLLRLATVVFGALQDRQSDNLFLETVGTFRQRVFENMTRMSIDYFERTRAGEIMDRFGGILSVTQWLFSLTEGTLASILQVLFILVVLCVKAPLVGVLMLLLTAFNLALSLRTVRRSKPLRRGFMALVGRMTGLLAEMIGNIATVRSFGGEPAVQQRYDETQSQWRTVRRDVLRLERRSTLILNAANGGSVFLVAVAAAYGALHGRFTPGDVLLLLMLTQNLLGTLAPISRQINQAADIDTTAERLVELLDVDAELPDAPDAVDLDEPIRTVEFQDVGFHYPGQDAPALQNVSFRLSGGQTLALVGLSGSGKSTIVKLLMRFYDPTSGRILVNGRDLRGYRQRSVRAQLGVVLQEVALFNDDVAQNIAFAQPGVERAQIEQAARAAQADGFIRRLPEQYDTLVGERGVRLSGGERQRIAIARAILKSPALIVLDEATSALDSQSERLVQQALETLTRGRAVVVIAHRLSTVMNADQILVLEHGRVIEQGRHAELAARDQGLYSRLLALQTGGPIAEIQPA